MTHDQNTGRAGFAGRIGFILAAAGSAVGLGNIWLFPYLAGENGGAAFVLIYLLAIGFVGMPVMLAEFVIGRAAQSDQVQAYSQLAPGKPWCLNGLMGLLVGIVILSFYCPVAGWVLAFAYKMIFTFDPPAQGDMGQAEYNSTLGAYFTEQTDHFLNPLMHGADGLGAWEPMIWTAIIVVINGAIIMGGIQGGIERSCKILMPALVILMFVLLVRSLTLPGMKDGLLFLTVPDPENPLAGFRKLLVGKTWVAAMTQAFFTLSLAMGAMMTYASYVRKEVNLAKMVVNIAAIDTGIALLGGLIIFPAVFAFGLDPAGGPGLVFMTIPVVFFQIPFGRFIGALFFILLTVAATTSVISLMEPIVTWFVDSLKIKRRWGALTVAVVVFVLAIPVSMSVTEQGLVSFTINVGDEPIVKSLMDLMELISMKIAMPLGAFVICMFVGFGWNRAYALQEAVGSRDVPGKLLYVWYVMVVTITPLLILIVLVFGVMDTFGLVDNLVEAYPKLDWLIEAPAPADAPAAP